jgi:hypothetical protein
MIRIMYIMEPKTGSSNMRAAAPSSAVIIDVGSREILADVHQPSLALVRGAVRQAIAEVQPVSSSAVFLPREGFDRLIQTHD